VAVDGAPGSKRRGPKRALIFAGAGAFIVGLAFLVARPSADPPAVTPYAGVRGASRAQASGLAISFRRGGEVRAMEPGTPLRRGDVLRFKVRAERPRYLLVRLRDGGEVARTVFPAAGGAGAVQVQPGEALPITVALGPSPGKVVVTAIFADHAFLLSDARGAGTEEIDVVTEKAEPGL
jgi:hypothetical protein